MHRVKRFRSWRTSLALAGLVLATAGTQTALAQPAQGSARANAPYDLTGYWVAVITEDWRWRMMTPPVGDFMSIPMTAAAREAAMAWDIETDIRNGNECRAYGAGGIMRVPTRLHITWEDDNTLRIDTDAGMQTRLFHFGEFEPVADSWQGNTVAQWVRIPGFRGAPSPGGNLRAVTTGMRSGYVRWNGIPYSENAVQTEYFDRHSAFGDEWLTVTSILEDPVNFTQRYITSPHFKREPDGSNWNPTPCVTDQPTFELGPEHIQ